MSRVSDVTVELEAERRGLLANRDLSTVSDQDLLDELDIRNKLPKAGDEMSDNELAEELHRRGYSVNVVKTIKL